jgi:quinol monooxygenase YgiN
MSVLIQMTVKVPDVAKVKSAYEWFASLGKPKGHISSRVFRLEGDTNTLCFLDEWESHDAFHASSEEVGEEFNRRAGTEGLDWVTSVWAPSDFPEI